MWAMGPYHFLTLFSNPCSPGCEDPPITFIVDLLTDLLNLAILTCEQKNLKTKYLYLKHETLQNSEILSKQNVCFGETKSSNFCKNCGV